jgi:hypothetical protein
MAPRRLTPEQVAFFKREGWLLLENVLDPSLMDRAVDDVWSTVRPCSRSLSLVPIGMAHL